MSFKFSILLFNDTSITVVRQLLSEILRLPFVCLTFQEPGESIIFVDGEISDGISVSRPGYDNLTFVFIYR